MQTVNRCRHDVVVVGYVPNLPDKKDPRGDSFIIMNSYGPDWGQHGFAYIKVETARMSFRAGQLQRKHVDGVGRPHSLTAYSGNKYAG